MPLVKRFALTASCICIIFALTITHVKAAEDSVSPYDVIEQMIEEADYKKAEDLLHDRLATNEKDVVALSMLAEVYRLKGIRAKAIEILDKTVGIDPDYPEVYFVLAKVYLNMQRYDEAAAQVKLFKDKMKPFLTKNSPSFDYYMRTIHYLANEYLILKRYDLFRSEIDEALRLNPQDQMGYYNLGVYYYQYKHDRPSAFQAFDKALKIDPDTPTAKKSRYAIEFIRANSDSRITPDFSFIDQEYKN